MTVSSHPKNWLIIALLLLLLLCMLHIINKHNEAEELRQNVDEHSQIAGF